MSKRKKIWQRLKDLAKLFSIPGLHLGDFNEILFGHGLKGLNESKLVNARF